MSAKFVKEITVIDPDTGGEVGVSIFKDDTSGGMFGVDSSYLDQCFEDDGFCIVPNIFKDTGYGTTLFEKDGVTPF